MPERLIQVIDDSGLTSHLLLLELMIADGAACGIIARGADTKSRPGGRPPLLRRKRLEVAAALAASGVGPGQRLIYDAPNGSSAPSALGTAA